MFCILKNELCFSFFEKMNEILGVSKGKYKNVVETSEVRDSSYFSDLCILLLLVF